MPRWRTIPSVPSYEASSDGQIRRGKRVLAQFVHASTRGEYMRVQVWIDGKVANRRVNRLVCEAFHGAPTEGDQARHLDGNFRNNAARNLDWGSARENYLDQVRHGTAFHRPLGAPIEAKKWRGLVYLDRETYLSLPKIEQREAKKFFSAKRLLEASERKSR